MGLCSGRSLLAAAMFLVAMISSSIADPKHQIRLGLQSVPTDLLYQAKDWGAPYELDAKISMFSSAGDSLKAFLAGRVDVVTAGAARLVTLTAAQPDKFHVVAVSLYGGDRYGLIVGPKSNYKTINDLKGKKVGVIPGSGAYMTFVQFLEKHDLTLRDFEVVNMKLEDISTAVSHGVIDGGVIWEPQVAIAEVSGVAKRLVSMKGVAESPFFMLASRSYVENHPDNLVRYIASAIDMTQFIEKSPEKADLLIGQELNKSGIAIDTKAIRLALSRMEVDLDLKPSLVGELEEIAAAMIKSNQLKSIPDFKAVIDRKFYDQASEMQKQRASK